MTKPTNTLMNELHIRYADDQTACLVLYKIKGMERRSKINACDHFARLALMDWIRRAAVSKDAVLFEGWG